jgi:hypothetical protein
MPRENSLVLSDLTDEFVGLACGKCGRRGRYRIAGLIAEHGADAKLVELRLTLAACDKAFKPGERLNMHDLCGVHWEYASPPLA